MSGHLTPADKEIDDGSVHATVFASPSQTEIHHEHIVQWQGPWEDVADGTSQATRRYALALATSGVPVSLRTTRKWVSDIDPGVLREVNDLRRTEGRVTSAVISHFIPTPETARSILYPGRSQFMDAATAEMAHKFRIALIVLERDRVSAQLASYLDRFAAVVVPCLANAQALKASGVGMDKVHVIPHPYPKSTLIRTIGEHRTKPGSGSYLFYTIAKWEPRKAIHAAIGAFLRTFGPAQNVMYAIKTSEFGTWDSYPAGPAASVLQWLEDRDVKERGWNRANVSTRLRITTQRLSEDEIAQMHSLGHCYVSASHGEAWDMPAFDATVARARLIHVGYGGSSDYHAANAITVARPAEEMVPCHRGYGWGNALWANVSVAALGDAMAKAERERKAGDPVAVERFSYETVGRSLSRVVGDVVRAYGGAPAWLEPRQASGAPAEPVTKEAT